MNAAIKNHYTHTQKKKLKESIPSIDQQQQQQQQTNEDDGNRNKKKIQMVFCSLNRFIIIWKGFRFRRLNQKKKNWMNDGAFHNHIHTHRETIPMKKNVEEMSFCYIHTKKTLGIDHPSIHLFFIKVHSYSHVMRKRKDILLYE